jgi:hypothetical protein
MRVYALHLLLSLVLDIRLWMSGCGRSIQPSIEQAISYMNGAVEIRFDRRYRRDGETFCC